jgi:hypothetical protein
MCKLTLLIGFSLLTSVFVKSQTDTICNLIIRASSDSIIYKNVSTIDSVDSEGFRHMILTEKAIIYLQIDSIVMGDYPDKNIIVESEPIISHMVTENIRAGESKTRLLTGTGVHRIKYSNYIFQLRRVNDLNIICK